MLVSPSCLAPRRHSHQRLRELHRFSHPQRTQVPIATEDFGDQRLLAPVIIAMNVVLPCLSIGILIWLLRSAE